MKESDPLIRYKETQIKTATQGKLIVMLYDGAIKYLNLAVELLEKKHRKYDKASNAIIRVQDIISELMVSLDFEKGGEIAKNLFSLYMYMNKQLLSANIKKDCKYLLEVKKLLSELRDAWNQVASKNPGDQNRQNSGGINIAG